MKRAPQHGKVMMRRWPSLLTTAIFAALLGAPAGSAASLSGQGQAAAVSHAEADTPRVQRLLALEILKTTHSGDAAAEPSRGEAVSLLKSAARGGDNFALITLERMRRAGEPAAPAIADMVEIEIARAERGDAVAAWRLAQRYETGDGVAPSVENMARWLQVAAGEAAGDFPKARDAAWRLCALYGSGAEAPADMAEARMWCGRAAGAGHAGAAMVIARLRGVDE